MNEDILLVTNVRDLSAVDVVMQKSLK